MLAVFTYGFDIAESNFNEKQLELHTLSDYEHLIQQASETHFVKEDQLNTLREWRKNPSTWQNK